MADSTAVRARRSRLHRRGDHSLCRPQRCSSAEAELKGSPDPPAVKGDPGRDKSAQRARRYRRHKSGDHSLCLADRCPAVTPDAVTDTVTPVTTPQAEPLNRLGLADTGRQLWTDANAAGPLGPLQAVLLLEACRIADRLDKLDRQLRGEEWLRFRHNPDDESEVTVYIDRVLAEAREQAVALKGIVAELSKPANQAKPSSGAKGSGGGLADLSARIAARRSSSTG